MNITFPGIEKAGDNTVEKTYTETVAVAEMPAAALFGTWSGKFNYNVVFDDGKEPTVMFYDVRYESEAGSAYIFNSDGTFLWDFGNEGGSGNVTGTYTTNGQEIICNNVIKGSFSEDGYVYSNTNVASPWTYTP